MPTDPVEAAIEKLKSMSEPEQLSFLFGTAYVTLVESGKALDNGNVEAATVALGGCLKIMDASPLTAGLRQEIAARAAAQTT